MKVAVIQGGPSAEAEVSRSSAKGVAGALVAAGHDPHRLELNATLPQALLQGGFEVAFPVAHGRLGEDGALQGLLEILGLPYVGSGVLAAAIAMDKVAAKLAFRAAMLPLAAEVVIRGGDDIDAAVTLVLRALGDSVVVKPSCQGSAIGVTRVRAASQGTDLRDAIATALRFGDTALVERFVRGREVTCAILDVPSLGGIKACPPTEIFSNAADWYDFASRYAPGGSDHQCPANLSTGLTQRVQDAAIGAHRALGCRDLSRVDFVVGDGDDPDAITLLEVNVLPGMTATSLYPEAAAAAGLAFPTLCDALVRWAIERAAQTTTVAAIPLPQGT